MEGISFAKFASSQQEEQQQQQIPHLYAWESISKVNRIETKKLLFHYVLVSILGL